MAHCVAGKIGNHPVDCRYHVPKILKRHVGGCQIAADLALYVVVRTNFRAGGYNKGIRVCVTKGN